MDNTKIKILFFCPYLGRGGAEKHFARLIAHLDKDRFDIVLITSRSKNEYDAIVADDRIRKISLGIDHKSSLFALFKSIMPLKRIIEAEKPAVVATVMDMVNLMGWLVSKISSHSYKTVYLVQASLSQAIKFKASLLKKLLFHIMPSIYKRADQVIVLSEGVRQEIIQKIGRDKDHIITIHNIGIVENDALSLVNKQSLRKQYSLVCCGRLVALKGFDLIIRAIPIIKESFPEVNLTILGSGPEEVKLKTLADELGVAEHVIFTGLVPDPEKYFKESQIFLLTSYLEGFGNVIVEAMACESAVIATDCPHGPREIIEDGYNGLLIPMGDVSKLAEAVMKLFQQEELMDQLSREGVKRAKHFTPDCIVREYEQAFIKSLQG